MKRSRVNKTKSSSVNQMNEDYLRAMEKAHHVQVHMALRDSARCVTARIRATAAWRLTPSGDCAKKWQVEEQTVTY